jgi:hypothetical protein
VAVQHPYPGLIGIGTANIVEFRPKKDNQRIEMELDLGPEKWAAIYVLAR